MSLSIRGSLVGAIMICTLSPLSASATPLYHVVNLGTANLFGPAGTVSAINSKGQILGIANGQPAIDTNGQITILPWTENPVYVESLNDNGAAVGTTTFGGGHQIPYQHAVLWQNGVMTDLGVIGGTYSEGYGINDSGQIVGVSNAPGVNQAAFIYQNGQMTSLGSLGGIYSWAFAISNNGHVTGLSSASGVGPSYPFLYYKGAMSNLGLLPGFGGGLGNAVNDAGKVVGYMEASDVNDTRRAFYYSNGVMTELGNYGGYDTEALAINSQGEAVGFSSTPSLSDRGFLYSGGTMYDLNTLFDPSSSNWYLSTATAINDNGWIVGIGENTITGATGPLLLIPVPEPSSLWLAGLGTLAAALTWFRIRSRPRRAAERAVPRP